MREIILTVIGVTIIVLPIAWLGLAVSAAVANGQDKGKIALGLIAGAIMVASFLLYLGGASS